MNTNWTEPVQSDVFNTPVILVGRQMNSIGGIKAVNLSLQRALIANGCPCDIFSFRDISNVSKGFIRQLIFDVKRFVAVVNEHKGSFVFNVTGVEIILFSIICLLRRRDFHYWLHGDPDFFEQNKSSKVLKKIFFRLAKSVVVLHQDFVSRIAARGVNVISIPNIMPQLARRTVVGEIAISRVVWVGRISAEKNPQLAFDTLTTLAKIFPSLCCVYVSPNSPPRLFEKLGVPKNFLFVEGRDFIPENWFDASSLHLLTSTLEAMPGVLFESTSCGSNFLTTQCSPWVEDLCRLGHGSSVPVDITVDDLVTTLSGLVTNNKLIFPAEEISRFLAEYSEKKVAQRWATILGTGEECVLYQ